MQLFLETNAWNQNNYNKQNQLESLANINILFVIYVRNQFIYNFILIQQQ